MPETIKIAVVIPSYNEAIVIRSTLLSVLKHGFTVVLVDDCSTDDTFRIVRGLPVHYLRHPVNLGQGAAIQTGIQFSLSLDIDYVVTFDADGQHVADDIKPIVDKVRDSSLDIVFGSRFLTERSHAGMSWSRQLILKTARYINFLLSGLYLTDAHNGLRALTSQAAQKIALRQNRMSHATELLIETRNKRLQYAEFQSRILYTDYAKNKGQKNLDGLIILKDIVLYKIFNR